MGCKLRRTRVGTLAFRLYWQGREWQERAGERDTKRSRERLRKIADEIDAEIRSGTFSVDRYRHWFADGARKEWLGIGQDRTRNPRIERMTVRAYAEHWLSTVSPPAIRESLHYERRGKLRLYVLPYIGDVELGELGLSAVERWRGQLFAKGLAQRSVESAITGVFRAMWKHADQSARPAHLPNPFDGLRWVRAIPVKREPFTADERDRIIAAAKAHAPWTYPFIVFLFGTGCRPSEACGLEWDCVDLATGKARIMQSRTHFGLHPTKTRASTRTIQLSPDVRGVLECLRRRTGRATGPVFVGARNQPIVPQRFAHHGWPVVLDAAGVTYRPMYATRHTYISQAVSLDANLSHVAEYCGTSREKIEAYYLTYQGDRSADPLTLAMRRKTEHK